MPKNFTNTTCRSYAITIAFTFQLACPIPTINRKISQLIIEIIARSIMIICNQIAQREIIFSTRKYLFNIYLLNFIEIQNFESQNLIINH